MLTSRRPRHAGRGAATTGGDAAPPVVDLDQRVAEADRNVAVAQLRRHVGAGHLDLDEYEQRVGGALAAGTGHELAAALRDLPALPPPVAPRTPADVRADRRAALAPFVSVMALLLVIWAVTGAGHFWPVWPLLGWGIPVLVGVLRAGREGHGTHPHAAASS